MSDLVQRLRSWQWHCREIGDDTFERSAAPWEAADRIEALEAVHTDPYTPCPKCGFVVKIVPQQPFVIEDDE